MSGRLCRWTAAVMLALWGVHDASAQYPDKLIHVIVPTTVGSTTDILSRIVTDDVTARTQAKFVVESKPGAAGAIAASYVAKTPPDGYTLMTSSSAIFSSGPHTAKRLAELAAVNFSHLAALARFDLVLVVGTASKVNSVRDLVALAAPGKALSFGYASATSQIGATAFASTAKFESLAVSYRGQPLALTDLAAGQTQFVVADVAAVLPLIAAQKIRPIGVFSDKRSALLPETPTLKEQGIPLVLSGWIGFSASPGLSNDAAQAQWLRSSLRATLRNDSVVQSFLKLGLEPMFIEGPALDAYLKEQQELWGRFAREANIVPE